MPETMILRLESCIQFHEVWARATGTQLREAESGFRYSHTMTFETFPFPEPDEGQRAAVAGAAARLNELREGWLNPEGATESQLKKRTLTNLYNRAPGLAGQRPRRAGRRRSRRLRLARQPAGRRDTGAAAGAEFGTGRRKGYVTSPLPLRGGLGWG